LVNQSESARAQVVEKNRFLEIENRSTTVLMKNDFWFLCMATALVLATLAPVVVLAA
jgi:hypothetical protein